MYLKSLMPLHFDRDDGEHTQSQKKIIVKKMCQIVNQ